MHKAIVKENNMLLFSTKDGYKKICIWKDEIPFEYSNSDSVCVQYEGDSDIEWYNGIICMEVKLHPRHISNYAMLCIRYNKNEKSNIIINNGVTDILFDSRVLPYGKKISTGLTKEYIEIIEKFFKEYSSSKLPNGTIEVITGGYDDVGSSACSFEIIIELLMYTFARINQVSDQQLLYELISMI